MTADGPDREWLEIDCFDQLPDVLPGLETEPVQLSSGRLDLALDRLRGGDFSLARMSLSPRVADHGAVRQGSVVFVLAEAPQVWCGLDIAPGTLLLMRPGRELRSVLAPGFRSLEYHFSDEALCGHPLREVVDSLGDDPESAVFPVDDVTCRRLQVCMDVVMNLGPRRGSGRCLSSALIRDLQLDLLAGALVNASPAREVGYRPHYDLAVSALEVIDREGATTITTKRLAARLDVSRRTLEKAFKSVLATSPAQYLLACRLTEVRERLARDGGKVGDVAFALGFNDPSRFAFQYARLFGELPSATLDRHPARRGRPPICTHGARAASMA